MSTTGGKIAITCGLFLGTVLPSPAQVSIQTINFVGAVNQALSSNQAIPDGAPVSGSITFDYDKMVLSFLDGLIMIQTNAGAMVSVNVNGTVFNSQGMEAMVDNNNAFAPGGFYIYANRMVIYLPPFNNFNTSSNSIALYVPAGTLRDPPAGFVDFMAPGWWTDRLPYPADYAVRFDGLVAPLSVYGVAPVLGIGQTNGGVMLAYPTNADGYVLESSPQPGASWQAVTNTPVLNGANWNVTLPNGSNSLFFRLSAN